MKAGQNDDDVGWEGMSPNRSTVLLVAGLPRLALLRIVVGRAEEAFSGIFRGYRRCAGSTPGYCLASHQDVFVSPSRTENYD
jgi:hypothetical protein